MNDPIIRVLLLVFVFGLAQYFVEAIPLAAPSKMWLRGGLALGFTLFCLRTLRLL